MPTTVRTLQTATCARCAEELFRRGDDPWRTVYVTRADTEQCPLGDSLAPHDVPGDRHVADCGCTWVEAIDEDGKPFVTAVESCRAHGGASPAATS